MSDKPNSAAGRLAMQIAREREQAKITIAKLVVEKKQLAAEVAKLKAMTRVDRRAGK